MFRYIGFSWNVASETQGAMAERLAQALLERGPWHEAFQACGHRVYVTGNAHGVNDVYALPANQGVVLGRLFRRGASGAIQRGDICLTSAEAERIVHSEGRSLIEQFWGRYIAFLPSRIGEARVLRDPTGTLPCYQAEVEGVTIVLSWLEDLFCLSDLPIPAINWEAVAAHMVLFNVGGRQTLLNGITQVLPGELTSMAAGAPPPIRLWSAVDHARRASPVDPGEASRRLRDTLAECVQSWASCFDAIVLRLSGGLDSAIMLANLSPAATALDVVCLNYYATDTDTDERDYARLVAGHNGATLIERPLDEGFRLESVLDVARTPLPANYLGSMGTARTDAAVAAGHRAGAVFNGAGGDQLLYELRCTWPAADYLKLRGPDRGFLKATLDSAHLGSVSFWRALRQAFADRAYQGNPLEDAGRFVTLMQREAMASALKTAHQYIHPSLLEAQDLPIGKFHQLGMLAHPFEYYNHHLREASAHRVQPLMSQPLLEFCLATPTFVLTQGGRGRGLARGTFADRLRPEIANRSSKGGMNDYIATVLQRNLTFARQMLLEGQLAKRGLLDRDIVEAALAGRPGKACYVSEIHACIATEAWLQRASSASTCPI
ncbi:asparagine synthase-related protein [Roseateles cellulosilyticus]|uniref:Asparagine synthase-related protein n=1 Tax=Pelomonas cellulosilytica TaxID=2906762 RepID=A0ABS8Y1B8_9BURK|nr:asparagine synthase-related protein [Pelomonas sp. P8]MCE4558022.1 asparagine synthase-related protein [Pelomonas sp. P8]